jgi:hypothetical protein
MRSPRLMTVALVLAVLGVLTMPVAPARADKDDDLQGLKRLEVDCKFLFIGSTVAACEGKPIGTAQLTEVLFTFGTFLGGDGSGGGCFLDSSTDTLTTPDGSTITFKTHGMICTESVPGFAVRHNSYLIEGGTGRFQGVTGTGNFVLSSENPIGSPLVHIDGNINFPGK